MASLLLGVGGSILGGPLGGALGALLGGVIDQTIIAPALFPTHPLDGPKLTEIKLNTVDEGAPANFLVGGTTRVAGTTIWTSPLIREKRTEHVDGGGKGGGGGSSVKKNVYFAHVAVAITIGQIASLQKIIANGKVLYDANPNVAIASNQLSVTVLGSGGKRRMKINSPAGGPDLSKLKTDKNVVVAGFSNGANNGTFRCLGSSHDNSTGASTVTLKNNACVAETAGASVTLNQTLPPFDQSKVENVTFYNGNAGQNPDPLIESFEGTGNVPGFRGTAYVVLQKLALEDYGNTVPQQLNFLISSATTTLAGAIGNLMARSGRSSGEYDTTAVTGTIGGYAISGPQSTGQALQPLLFAYDILAQETNGVLKFFPRKTATIYDIPSSLLAAKETGTETPRPIHVEKIPGSKLPREVAVKFIDLERDDLTGSVRYLARDATTDFVLNVDFPLVFNSKQAQAIAVRLHWIAKSNSELIKFTLPPQQLHRQENDVVRLKALNEPWLLLVQKVTLGHNQVIEVEALREDRGVLTQVEEGEPPNGDAPTVNTPAATEQLFFEGPPLTPSAANPANPVVYGGGCSFDPGHWGGALTYISDDEQEWSVLTENETEASLGYAVTALGGTGVVPHTWDRVSTVDVDMVHGVLASASEIDVLNGLNRARIGTEVIAFATATLIGPGRYRLSDLLRGLRNTESKVATHAVDEFFVHLNAGGLEQAILNPAWIGQTKYFRFVASGKNVADETSIPLAITGETMKCFSPVNAVRTTAANGDITISWARRTRAVVRLFAPIVPPLCEYFEKYDVEVWYPAGGGGSLVRAWSDVTTPSVAFPTGEHGAIPSGASFEARIWQKSQALGRGTGLVQTI